MTLLIASPLLLAALAWTPQEPGARPARMPEDEALELDRLLLEITERVRWPLTPEKDLMLLVRPADLDPRGSTILLGPWLWHRRWEFPVPMGRARGLGSPFRGATMDAAGKGHLILDAKGKGHRFAFRIERCQASAALWPGEPGPRMPALRLHLDGLTQLLPDAAHRRRFVEDQLMPAFRRASAAQAPDPGPGLRGRAALARPASQPVRRQRRWHSRDLGGLPLLGFLCEDEAGKLSESPLQRAAFEECGLVAQARIYRSLLARFVADLRWPLPDPPEGRSARRLHPDDGWNRAGLEEHAALDLGSLAPDRGKERQWQPGTPVGAPAVGVHPLEIPRKDGRAWVYEARSGRHRLRLLLALYHLEEGPGAPVLGEAPPGGFERSDPWALLRGWPKGPHTHFEILGLAPGNPSKEAFWVRQTLVTALLAAPSAAPAARVPRVLPSRRSDPQMRALALIAHHLPVLPGLKSCRERHQDGKALPCWEFTASRSIPWPAGWKRVGGEVQGLLGPAGQPFALLRLRGRMQGEGKFAPGPLLADLELQQPAGRSLLAAFQEPLRQRLLSELLPELLLRGPPTAAK